VVVRSWVVFHTVMMAQAGRAGNASRVYPATLRRYCSVTLAPKFFCWWVMK
jgi:hypothetical protein